MSDDLVKNAIAELQDDVRCRCHPAYKDRGLHDPDCNCDNAGAVQVVADRIEKLQAENERLRSLVVDVINDTGDDPEIMAASRAEWAARALEAEAKLAKAMDALDFYACSCVVPCEQLNGSCGDVARKAIAELKGKK